MGASHTDMDLDIRRKELEAALAHQNGGPHEPVDDLDAGGGLRFRGQHANQEVVHLGTIPKRTESLYLKQSLDSKGKVECKIRDTTDQVLVPKTVFFRSSGYSGWDVTEKEESTRCSMPGRDHKGSRLKGHDS
jgi:hypothetical protein